MDETDPGAWLGRQWRKLLRRLPWMVKRRARRATGWLLRRIAALRTAHREAMQVAVLATATERRRREQAEATVSRMREVLDGLCEYVGGSDAARYGLMRDPAWLARGRRLVREVDGLHTRMAFAAMQPPVARFEYDPLPFRTVSLELLKFACSVGLSEGTPPELVADDIAARVRAAVLEQWKNQAVLS